jgi:vitamin B12 transporter
LSYPLAFHFDSTRKMRLYVCSCALFLSFLAHAQEAIPDTSLLLPLVEVSASRLFNFSPGMKLERMDSALISNYSNTSISSLVLNNSSAYARSYGTGGLSTLSIRGSQATQAGIFWNGFNLNQPNLGMTDLSLIPVFLFSEVALQYGGASALYGSGLIGGSLHLTNTPEYSSPLTTCIQFSPSSTRNYTLGGKLSYGNDRFSIHTAATGSYNQNHFAYDDLSGNRQFIDHATNTSGSFLNQLDVRLSSKHHISSGLWLQSANRELPPTMVMAKSDQTQSDKAIRFTFQYSFITPVQRLQLSSAVFSEYSNFKSPVASIDAVYHLDTYGLDADYRHLLGKRTTLNVGSTGRLLKANVPYYKDIKFQPEFAIYFSILHAWQNSGWKSVLNLRKDFIQGYNVPFCPSVGLEGKLIRGLFAKVSVSRNFRVPTMNDRFWQPGGNPDLKPESSYNQEISVIFAPVPRKSRTSFEFEVTPYNMWVDNLIQWVNISSNVWSPMNVRKVWSRGIETKAREKINIGIIHLNFIGKYTYSASTFLSLGGQDQNAGKQQIYNPMHKLNLQFLFQSSVLDMSCSSSLVGKRYTSVDNSEELPGYVLLDLTIGRKIRHRKYSFYLQLQGKNILNSQYQAVRYYPEPGISIMANLILTYINKPK